MKTAIEKLVVAIGYPERVPDGALSFTFRVDGAEIHADESDGRIVLVCVLSGDESLLPMLVQYAAGRMLKEDAAVSFGLPGVSSPGPRFSSKAPELQPAAFLWQDASADADARLLRRLFESFLDSCDWWRARVDALRGGEASESDGGEMMMIRP